jgi:hypothetical protein
VWDAVPSLGVEALTMPLRQHLPIKRGGGYPLTLGISAELTVDVGAGAAGRQSTASPSVKWIRMNISHRGKVRPWQPFGVYIAISEHLIAVPCAASALDERWFIVGVLSPVHMAL